MLSSVTNALRVLEHLVQQGEAGISETARALDLTVGTAHRLVATLVDKGYAEQNPSNRRYRPGRKIPELSRSMRGATDFVTLAHGKLIELMETARDTVNLAVMRDHEVVYIDRAVTDQPLAVTVNIGSRVPVYCTSLGRAILAFSDDAVVDDYLARLPELAARADQPAPTADELKAIVTTARDRGYAEDNGEFAPDIACIAAPILDRADRSVAAVSVACPQSRMTKRRTELVPMVRQAAEELSTLVKSIDGNVRI